MNFKERVAEFFWFSILGLVGVSIGYLVLLILLSLDVWYLWSSIIAYIINVLISFLIHKFHTFKDENGRKIIQVRQISFYFLVSLTFFGINTGSLYVLVEYYNIYYLYAQIALTIILGLPNYLATKEVFKSKSSTIP